MDGAATSYRCGTAGVIIAGLLVTACSQEPVAQAPGGANAPRAVIATEAAWGATTVVEELSMGVEYGADELMFGAVLDVAVAADGRMFVYQLSPRVVREYDAEGGFIRQIGREGQGPGEYLSPAIEVLPDGRLALWDLRNSRLSLYETDGSYERGLMVNSNIGGANTFSLDIAGNLYVRNRDVPDTPPASEFDIPYLLDKYSQTGDLLETIPIPPRARDQSDGRSVPLREGPESFPIETLSAWSPLGYLVTGRNDRYEVEVRAPSGTITISREVEAATVAPEELDEWNAFRTRFIEINPGVDLNVAPIPTTKPFFSALQIGSDGRVWIRRYVDAVKRHDIEPLPEQPDRPMLTWREPPTYDVFEPDGTFLGTVFLPNDFTPHVFRGEHVWGVHMDVDGVERIKRLRIERS